MFRTRLCLLLLGLALVDTAGAQELPAPLLLLPGSVNATLGSVGPLEPGNVVGNLTVEQGFRPWHRGAVSLVGFVDLTVRADTKGYTWNNTTPYVTGVKLVAAGRHGVLQGVVGVAGDFRSSGQTSLTPSVYFSYWTGWQRAHETRKYPGSMWATSGIATAREPDNWITSAHVDQGVTVWRGRGVALLPFGAATATTDTEGQPWNNRGFVDAGLKVATTIKGGVIEAGVAQRIDRKWQSGTTDAAPVVFVNLWIGWTPRLVR